MNMKLIARILFVAGILISLATFLLRAIPTNWGLFLSAACFVVGGMLWPDWHAGDDGKRDS